jgi:hypothetical protein
VELALHVRCHQMRQNASLEFRCPSPSEVTQTVDPVQRLAGVRLPGEAGRAPTRSGTFYLDREAIAPLCVLFLTILLFGYGLGDHSVASSYTDPVSKIRAQDESLYVNSATHMVQEGDWLTPRFLDRLLLYKPPLLIWLAALSGKIFGLSIGVFRLPALLSASLATLLLFMWSRSRSSSAAWVCALLLLANPLWYLFARLCYTDMLFAASVAAAVFVIRFDHTLTGHRSRWLFALCCAAGILTKNVAGLLPFAIWMVFCVFRRVPWRVMLESVVPVALFTFVLAAPWHLYQLAVHPEWFWADYVEVQLLGFGLRPPVQSSAEPQLWFYWKRLFITDPILVVMALMALPAIWRSIRRRESDEAVDATLLVSWLGVMTFALAAFGYRNLPYALNLIPPLAVMAALFMRGGSWRIVALAGVLVVRLSLYTTDPIPSAAALDSYAERGRTNDLIIVAPDDEFYSATLGLPNVRYAFIDNEGIVERYARHLVYLGVTMKAEQFVELERWRDIYSERLRAWGVRTTQPLGTAIVARSQREVGMLAARSVTTDFFLPEELLAVLPPGTRSTHSVVPAANGRVFLLAKPRATSEERQDATTE